MHVRGPMPLHRGELANHGWHAQTSLRRKA